MSLEWSGNHLIQSDEQLDRKDILVELKQEGNYFQYTVNAPGNLFGGDGGQASIYSSSIDCRSEAEAKKKILRLKVVEIFHVLWLINLDKSDDSVGENIRNLERTLVASNKRETRIRVLVAAVSAAISIIVSAIIGLF